MPQITSGHERYAAANSAPASAGLSAAARLRGTAVKLAAADKGLMFGPVHQANGYQFANAKDPDHNPVSISSRAFRSGGASAA